jgi:hypothetical protein
MNQSGITIDQKPVIDDLGMRKLLHTPQPRTSSRSSCAVTSGRPRCSPRIAPSTTGETAG